MPVKKLYRVEHETESLKVVLWFTDPEHAEHTDKCPLCPVEHDSSEPWLEIHSKHGDPSSPTRRQANFRLTGMAEFDELILVLGQLRREAQ